MPNFFYHMDGIRHDIKALTAFPLSVRVSDEGEIYITQTQNHICRDLKRLLVAWKRIAERLKFRWFLNGGSLLGTLRDKGLIFYDNDIDIVVRMADYDKLLAYDSPDGVLLTPSEAGFQLSLKTARFPFIDIWVIDTDKSDASKMCACGPVLLGQPTYYYQKVWPNEWYDKADLRRLQRAHFEGIEVFVPNNATTIVKRMYGRNCLVEYRMESHTDGHPLSQVFDADSRMKLQRLIKVMNLQLGLDRTCNIDGHLSCLMAKTSAELTVVSSSQKNARIAQYVLDYLRTNVLEDYARVRHTPTVSLARRASRRKALYTHRCSNARPPLAWSVQ